MFFFKSFTVDCPIDNFTAISREDWPFNDKQVTRLPTVTVEIFILEFQLFIHSDKLRNMIKTHFNDRKKQNNDEWP